MSQVQEQQVVEATPVALDRVMLAMDVVDTLRHQHELVERELDDDRRQHQLIERVQAIYESQGIEVSQEVVAEGVRALREDRFVYSPPRRSFSVRLAEVYVERGKWALRAAIALLLVVAAWATWAVPMHFHRQGLIEKFEQAVARLGSGVTQLADRGQRTETALGRSRAAASSPAESRLLTDAEGALADGIGQTDALATALRSLPAAEDYIEERTRWDIAIDSYGDAVSTAGETFTTARGLLERVDQLRALAQRLGAAQQRIESVELSASAAAAAKAGITSTVSALESGDVSAAEAALYSLDQVIDGAMQARQQEAETRAQFASLSTALDGVDVDERAASELKTQKAVIGAAMTAGDWERAGALVGKLRSFVEIVEQSYQLRIVSRPGDRSGVWRHPKGDRSQRNYYIIVEAVDRDGKSLSLSITSEEDQRTRRVERFGVRVPKSVYEQVKADKLDNGIIDHVAFGSKRRGSREPSYLFPVAGGHITRW